MKKIFCIAAAVLLAVSMLAFSACGGGEDAVDGISLNKEELEMEVGDTYQLSALVAPSSYDGTVAWKSDNESVAAVDDGLISAVSAGSAKITASAGGKSAVCSVTVAEKVQIPAINGFKAFEKGGLIGGEGGEYFPVTATAVGDDSVKYSGKGGLSWPDTVNNAEPDCMGGYYDEALALDGLKIKYTLDQPMDFEGDHWYFISLADRKQLFNNWNGEDPVKTLFFMIAYEDGNLKLKPHYHDLLEMGEGWSYLGASEGIPAESYSTPITIELNKTAAGYEVYLNGELQWFDVIKSSYITVADELFPDGECYLMAGAHIGNPGSQYEGEYAFTLGVDQSASEIVDVQSVSFEETQISIGEGNTAQVQAVVLPENATNKSVGYSSADETVATVDGTGLVTAVGVGETVISAEVQGISGECKVTVTPADVPVTGLSLDRSEVSMLQFEEITLTAAVQPSDASNRAAVWKVKDGAANVTIQVDAQDPLKAVIRGNHIGECTVQVSLGSVSDECKVSVGKGTLNGFVQFEKGGLVNETEYRSDITMSANGTDRVQFKGYGGTNWGDANSLPSTMGGMYSQALPINETEVYYSVDQWIDGATDHFYIIALSNAPEWFSDKADGNGTVFFRFAFNGGYVTLDAHYVGEGQAWTQIGTSQGIAAAGGQYVIRFALSDTGLRVSMRNAESDQFTQLQFGQSQEIAVAAEYFPEGEAYLMAGAYAKTFAGEWAFTLGQGAYDPAAGE